MAEIVQAVKLFTREWSAARVAWRTQDPGLYAVAPAEPVDRIIEVMATPFGALVRTILHQQVSIYAGRSIVSKLSDACGGEIHPERVLALTPDDLRAAGLSQAKIRYVRALAEAAIHGALDDVEELTDDEIEHRLVALPGVGVWTVRMFQLFHLGRPDVFSGGDLGLREAIRVLDRVTEAPSPSEAERRAEVWRPYRSIASVILWDFLRQTREAQRALRPARA
ncbi:MAG TPA: DNA-3-methyladenine glycosylase 2 family protein [Chloroflexota bacterium]|nr:DNA-3-methyladenine glycosylase 2 family protein [Chloroflexota bacterium]